MCLPKLAVRSGGSTFPFQARFLSWSNWTSGQWSTALVGHDGVLNAASALDGKVWLGR